MGTNTRNLPRRGARRAHLGNLRSLRCSPTDRGPLPAGASIVGVCGYVHDPENRLKDEEPATQ